MQSYKIRIPNPEISEQVQEKAFELGYKWGSGDKIVRLTDRPFIVISENGYFYSPSEETFNLRKNTEISYQDFLRLGEQKQLLINNQIQQQMNIKLKCFKAPQKAKNITIGKEYNGVYINGDDTQVDNLADAEYFQCINNSGVEAKYRLSLFEDPQPVAPAKITMAQAIELLKGDGDNVSLTFNGNEIVFYDCGTDGLEDNSVSCSCGIYSVDGLNTLFDTITRTVKDLDDELSNAISDFDEELLINSIFKAVVKRTINDLDTCFVLFSTTENNSKVCILMDEITTEQMGSTSTGFELNPNSHNQIKAWLIKK